MPHGQPDYGMYAEKRTTYGLADMGELAARLGSIVTFDRRGDVIWYEDFEDTYNKWTLLSGVDTGTVAQSNERARRGDNSLKITTGALSGGATGSYHQEPYPVLSKVGFEAHCHIYHATITFRVRVSIYTGTQRLRGGLAYDKPNTKWQYHNSGGTWTDLITGVDYPTGNTLFVPCKLVIDPTAQTYVRGIFSNREEDMSAIGLQVTADLVTAPHIEVYIYGLSAGTANQICYFDDIIITQNEP